jgi:hypothetical protein
VHLLTLTTTTTNTTQQPTTRKKQANEGLVQANLQLRNLLGAADQWRLSGEYGHRSSFDFAALFRLPRARGGDWTVSMCVCGGGYACTCALEGRVCSVFFFQLRTRSQDHPNSLIIKT